MKKILLLLVLILIVFISGCTFQPNPAPTNQTTTTTTTSTIPSNNSSLCHTENGLPDPTCTPGATNPDVTQNNIGSTICVSGYTATIRPPTSYTNPLKIQSIKDYGYSDASLADYEEDHLISLELGGNPTDVHNLWAEPHYGLYNSYNKDGFENYLHKQICNGLMNLTEAQKEISTNWVQYWIQAGEP
jgi:hypothetical protein